MVKLLIKPGDKNLFPKDNQFHNVVKLLSLSLTDLFRIGVEEILRGLLTRTEIQRIPN
jgi:hypothetical protein